MVVRDDEPKRFKFMMQFEYSIKTMLGFGSCPSGTIEEWLSEMLSRHCGVLERHFEEKFQTELLLQFASMKDAQHFYQEFHEKLTPRMFFDTKKSPFRYMAIEETDGYVPIHRCAV